MDKYGEPWQKCKKCKVTHTGVKDGKCTDEDLCTRLLTEKIRMDLQRLSEPIVGPVDLCHNDGVDDDFLRSIKSPANRKRKPSDD